MLVKDGLYKDVESQLRSGEIDFLISAFYYQEQELPDDLERILLFKAPLHIIVRPEHPLFEKSGISVTDLNDYSWILPPAGTAARRINEQLLSELELVEPHCQIEVYSYSIQSEILMNSDSLGLAFKHQSARDEQFGLLRALPIQPKSSVSVGITQRKHTTHSPPARVLQEALREMSGSLRTN